VTILELYTKFIEAEQKYKHEKIQVSPILPDTIEGAGHRKHDKTPAIMNFLGCILQVLSRFKVVPYMA
jgi:hypothetical protein